METENLDFIEVINEMASVRPVGSVDILLAVNPDDNRDGDPYFKMYDSKSWTTATKVWRISFTSPTLIKKHRGKIQASTSINSKEKNKLIEYLNKESRDFKDSTVWDELKYRWNVEKGLMDQFGFEQYKKGTADQFYKKESKENYVPYSLQQPDYNKL